MTLALIRERESRVIATVLLAIVIDAVMAAIPYGFATAAKLSLYRKPLMTTNLRFAGAIT